MNNGGVWKTNDYGRTWKPIFDDQPTGSVGDVAVAPSNPDVIYVGSGEGIQRPDLSVGNGIYKSADGGKTWTAFRGAPGGDDYHRLWINPNDPKIILLAGDQGAIITVNGGETFSSWYNQPTAQFYHVSTDNAFPYNVYGAQQESGSAGIASKGNDGEISFREWHPVGVEEYGYVAPDPLDPDIIYGGKITRYDKKTGQVQNIAPEAVHSGKYRFLRTAPVLFSPIDPKTLYFAGNVVFKTRDGGRSWQVISPDLTRENWDIPISVGIYTSEELKKMPRRGVVYTIAPSFKDINTLWAGTDDGLIQVTHDGGKTWRNVTPAAISSWSKVSLVEASHTDIHTAYAAVNRIRCDDMHPYIYKTSDGGKTWKLIVTGLPDAPINAVREDPVRKGLLFAGSENAVYVSFDDGEQWQSLRLNMPATSIRDLVIKNNDLVVGTHGRSFWILDDITALRQLNSKLSGSGVVLYKPAQAYRVRWNMNTDTPLPQEEPAGQNPPDGAIIDYYLKENATGEVTLEITDAAGKTIRKFSSSDKPYEIPDVNIPLYWIRPQQVLSSGAGAHRFLWDLHYTPLPASPSYPIAATFANTAPDPTSPWVLPGVYAVKLSVNGKVQTQTITVTMDPRVKTALSDLQLQHSLSIACYEARKKTSLALLEISSYGKQPKDPAAKTDEISKELMAADHHAAALLTILHDTDMPPTTQAIAAVKQVTGQMKQLLDKWAKVKNGSK
ncbi:MAG: hypothetical protein NVS3B15_01490 [Sediminibacterium sp.]